MTKNKVEELQKQKVGMVFESTKKIQNEWESDPRLRTKQFSLIQLDMSCLNGIIEMDYK